MVWGSRIEAQHQVFFHQLVQRRSQLVFIGARLRFDRIGHRGFGHRHRIDQYLMAFRAKSVARLRDAQLGDRAQITGMQFADLDQLAALASPRCEPSLSVSPRV